MSTYSNAQKPSLSGGFTFSKKGGLVKSKNDTRLHIGGVQFEAVCKGIKQAKKGRNLKQRKANNSAEINHQNAVISERMELNKFWESSKVQEYLIGKGYDMTFRAFEQKYKRQKKFKNDILDLFPKSETKEIKKPPRKKKLVYDKTVRLFDFRNQ